MPGAWSVLIVVAVVAVGLLVLFFWRLRTLSHRVGSFECALFEGKRWASGIVTYTRDHLDFYEVVSLSLRPSRRWARREMDILARERPVDDGPGALAEARCSYAGTEFQIAAEDGALDGLRSWLEAAPPDPSTSRIV
ncbi:DUF2550 family protein [Ruania albidiflava]|uniref:DUF2550 family protein n=1 Tax=Ruania albidiflava TaxID=366586 RepID=UPI0003B647AB|nr:DUF2550 family protein [Ruania albidiflava]